MSNSTKVTLNVRLDDPGGAYQITILDDAFRTVASGSGNLSVDLLPGIYKVQANISRQTWEKLVLLEAGSQPKAVDVPVLSINSPVPLANTAQHHEYHEQAAAMESRKVHFKAGSGSAIFVFSRYYSGTTQEKTSLPVHPFYGMALHDANGVEVADLQSISAADLSRGIDPWAACNILVDPGYYRLRLTLPSGDQVEQPLYTSLGWQLQVFALQSAFGPRRDDVRANLVEAFIFYKRFNPSDPQQCGSFNPNDECEKASYRLTELARQGLLDKRAVLKDEIHMMLWEKFENPMLGILGGHLLLMDATPDLNFLRIVVGNLRGLLGEHPDVEALALPLEEPQSTFTFGTLPMLRKSWKQVLKASIRRPEIVPIDSEASNLSNHLWGEGMWIFSTVKPPVVAANATSVVQSLTGMHLKENVLSSYEKAAVMQMSALSSGQSFAFSAPKQIPSPKDLPQLNDTNAEMMVDTLGVPRGNVEVFLQRASDKAQLYESIRSKLPSGRKRSRAMIKIVSEIRDATRSNKEDASTAIKKLLDENSDGSRIAAIGILQAKPDLEYFPFILEAIGQSRSAFEQYQALSSVRSFLPRLSDKQKRQLKRVIKQQRGDQPEQYIKAGSDRWVMSDMILRKLK
jgi:hypothetical protein